MVNIIKEELPIEESLKSKLELICEFSKITYTIINGNLRKIDKTNLTYIEPNKIIIKVKIKTLTENNKTLTLRVKTLNNNVKEKDNEISFLKSKISSLKNTIECWKDEFDKLISFLYSKLHNWYDKDDKYIDVVNDMYEDEVLDDDDIKNLDLTKEKDGFER